MPTGPSSDGHHRDHPAPEAPEPRALSDYRAAVTGAIREEERDVRAIVALLAGTLAWDRWPDRHRRPLMAAVTGEGDGTEAQKASALRRQLFRDAGPGWPPAGSAALS